MNPLKKTLSLCVGLVLLGTVAVLLGTSTVGASPRLNSVVAAPPTPSLPVAVTNTPLPVSIAGTPTVNANIGTPNVNINGTPTVNVNSSTTAPIYVDADRAARNSFDASCYTGPVDSVLGQAQCLLFTIPGGRQVVVESVSCTAEVTPGVGIAQADLVIPNVPLGSSAGTGASNYLFPLTMSKMSGNVNVEIWSMTTQVRAYGSAPGGDTGVYAFYRVNPTAEPQDMTCTVAGYLVP